MSDNRTAKEWGRVAVALPGWRWGLMWGAKWHLPGTRLHGRYRGMVMDPESVPDPDDPATAGCLLALLGSGWAVYRRDHDQRWEASRPDGAHMQDQPTIGRACIAAAEALGRWPGGGQ